MTSNKLVLSTQVF
ncbi:glycine cleavage system protein H [Vibrio splendidus 12B01]|nr:glycine cleavage system protein H [Vibrio splendidus 12B01]